MFRPIVSFGYHQIGRPLLTYILESGEFSKKKEEIRDTSELCFNIGETTRFSLSTPQGPNPIPKEIENKNDSYITKQAFVCEIPDVEVVGSSGLAITRDNKYILEEVESSHQLLASVILKSVYKSRIPVRRGDPKIRHEHPLAILCEQGSDGYYHWMAEYLPRVRGIERYAEMTGIYPDILISKGAPAWKRESLRHLGVPDEHVIIWEEDRLRADRFVVPSIPRHEKKQSNATREYLSSPRGVRWVADRMRDQVGVTCSNDDRILITRRNAHERRLVNEFEVIELLSNYGFTPHILDEMTVEEQIRLFANSETVIAPHGAGLVNIIFGDDINVLELFGDYYSNVFYTIAEALDHTHTYERCEDVDGDLLVDVERLKRRVEELLTG
jgi:capsular polysaccharide biosynthesis protein